MAGYARLGRVDTDGDASAGAGRDHTQAVIGTQVAAAAAAEARHQAGPHGPSPLAGVAYEPRLSLIHFIEVPTDGILDDFVARFAASGGEDRARLRADLPQRDLYTVLDYALRAAVRALRSGDGEVARRGVVALAAVDVDRVDWRDLAWIAGLLSYVLGKITGDAAGAFEAVAVLAEGNTAAFLSRQAGLPQASLSEWGFREISTSAGVGLIEAEGAPYRPDSDLVGLAEAVKAGMDDGTWQLSDPVTGSRLHAVWLRAGKPGKVSKALGSITGCVCIRGTFADRNRPGAEAQHMAFFLAETGKRAAARIIARSAGPGGGDSFVAVSAAAGTLCAVLIARSAVMGTPAIETQASLERFRPVLVRALAARDGRQSPPPA